MQPTGAYIFYSIYIYFVHIFLLINYSLRDPPYIHPRIFLFWRPHCATPIRDLISRLPFTTHVLRPTFATHVLRLTFVIHFRDSHSRLS